MPECKACGAPILWFRTQRGRAIPVDREPARGGNLLIEQGVAVVVPPTGALRHVSHYATCPRAGDFREKNRTKTGRGQLGLFGGKS